MSFNILKEEMSPFLRPEGQTQCPNNISPVLQPAGGKASQHLHSQTLSEFQTFQIAEMRNAGYGQAESVRNRKVLKWIHKDKERQIETNIEVDIERTNSSFDMATKGQKRKGKDNNLSRTCPTSGQWKQHQSQ